MLAVLEVVVAAQAAVSLAVALFALVAALSLRQLGGMTDELPAGMTRWPRVSLVIPACNEADTIGDALRSKLADGYPDLEVVVVDDRSDDGTGDVVRALAARDERVKLLRVDELPAGWLGKVHALHVGERAATGEWLLFSDADVRFAPGTMRRAVAFAYREERDLVALFPSMEPAGPLLDAALAAFMRVLMQLAPPWLISIDGSPAAAGSGSFNLVRRELWERTPGFEWLRMEAGDDVALGAMLKLCGGRCAVLGGKGVARVLFYPSVRALIRGVEKNIAFDTPLQLAGFFAVLAVCAANEYAAFAALAVGVLAGAPWLIALAGATWVAMTACTAAAVWADGAPVPPALGWPVGYGLLVYGLARAAVVSYQRGGVQWRGTFYPTRALHEGARLMDFAARKELVASVARAREAESA